MYSLKVFPHYSSPEHLRGLGRLSLNDHAAGCRRAQKAWTVASASRTREVTLAALGQIRPAAQLLGLTAIESLDPTARP